MGTSVTPDKDEHGNFRTVVVIQEESRDPAKITGSTYQAKSLDFPITKAGMDSKDFSFPYPIALFSAEWINEALYDGDCFKVLIAPDTPFGVLTSPHVANDTTLHVNDTVTGNIKVGMTVKLGTFDCGRCIAVDPDALTIEVENGLDQAYAALEPVLVTTVMVDGIRLSGSGRMELGKDVIGGSYIPKGAVIRIVYENNEGTIVDKVFSSVIEYKY